MLSRLPGSCLLSAFLWLSLASEGHAWTEAHVREAHASLRLSAHDKLDVLLDLTLEVSGGWLERLELPGLDEGLVLAEDEPASAVLQSGERVAAQVSQRASTLTLKFARHDGLRRGLHHLFVRYTKASRPQHDSASERRSERFYWTLPGFEAGLEQASIEIHGPLAIQAVSDPESAQEVVTREEGGQRVLRFSRLHVPRAVPWTVAVDVPSVQTAPVAVRERAPEAAEGNAWLLTSLLALSGFALIAAMRSHVDRALCRQGLARGAILLARPLSLRFLALLSLVAAASAPRAVPVSVACWSLMFVLGVPQARTLRGPLSLGSFGALTRGDRKKLGRQRIIEWLGVPWADLCSPLGALGALSLLLGTAWLRGFAGFGREPWSLFALCGCLGFLASARSLRPRSVSEQVALLVRAAERARLVGCAFALVGYTSAGRLSQPRLRILPGARYPGLLRLEVLVDTRRSARPLVLSALVESGSAAERWLGAHWPGVLRENSAGGRRVALLCPIEDVGRAAEQLLELLSVQSQRALFMGAASERAA